MNGQAHTTVTIGVTGLLCLAYALKPNESSLLYAAMGSALTLLVNPDADMEIVTGNERAFMRRVPLIGRVWLWLWYPYARMFRHRGVSHWPVVGTLTRAAYLGVLLTVGLMAMGIQVYIDDVVGVGGYVVIGMTASDVVHWLMDGMA